MDFYLSLDPILVIWSVKFLNFGWTIGVQLSTNDWESSQISERRALEFTWLLLVVMVRFVLVTIHYIDPKDNEIATTSGIQDLLEGGAKPLTLVSVSGGASILHKRHLESKHI